MFRKDLPAEMKAKLTDALIALMDTPEGQNAFHDLYGVTAFKRSTDSDYVKVRELLQALGKNAAELMAQ
jgi:ABC-type phosphate/phosphonate transport system substrate-binding protein